jgi:preprotein translocase subunit SecD
VLGSSGISADQQAQLEKLADANPTSILPPDVNESVRAQLTAFGFKIKEVQPVQDVPWIWTASGARQIISLREDVTNMEPYVANIDNAKIFSDLAITGSTSIQQEAVDRLGSLTILLESGSLPIPVESISKESISPLLGQEFLRNTMFIGIMALLAVALVLFIRYRNLKITVPILMTDISEVMIVIAIAALVKWQLDLASIAGIVAAVGTGVDDQIVVTDELVKGEQYESGSLVNRVKRAFFIVFASASTAIAATLPILLFGQSFGLTKLVGFAFTTILGVLVGVFITRPGFAEVLRYLIGQQKQKEQAQAKK